MKYVDMPLAMWLIFAKSFRNNLTTVLGIEPAKAKEITKKAKRKYKEIIARIPEFEKKDRFKMNLVNCAMFFSISAYTAYTSGCRCSNRIL